MPKDAFDIRMILAEPKRGTQRTRSCMRAPERHYDVLTHTLATSRSAQARLHPGRDAREDAGQRRAVEATALGHVRPAAALAFDM